MLLKIFYYFGSQRRNQFVRNVKKRKMTMLTNGLGVISVGDGTTTGVQALEESPRLNLCLFVRSVKEKTIIDVFL